MNNQLKFFCAILCFFTNMGALLATNTPSSELAALIASSRNPWRTTQEQVKDTVVQVFVLQAEVNLLQPYQTPEQGMGMGSGFFIDNDGHIVTNFHVVRHALATWIQVPSLGKKWIKVKVISVCPDRDIALLKLLDEDVSTIREQLGGSIPILPLGDSDTCRPSDDVLALGYPLGLQSVKSTTGVISGNEKQMIQISAPINPGSSGGPLLNTDGQVIGINTSGYDRIRNKEGSVTVQNTNFIIPINEFKLIFSDMLKIPFIRKPLFGILTTRAENIADYLGNPEPGGCFVVDLIKGSAFEKAGLRADDMIYEINGFRLDVYGDMTVPWSNTKISITDYASRVHTNEPVRLVVYRSGQRLEFTIAVDVLLPIRKIYPIYEKIDYEVFAGMVVMPLTINHIEELKEQAPGIEFLAAPKAPNKDVLVITHVFRDSQLGCLRVLSEGTTINEVNGIHVTTLDEFRAALLQGVDKKYIVIKGTDNASCATDNLVAVLPLSKVIEQEQELSRNYRYPMTDFAKKMLQAFGERDVQNDSDSHINGTI